MSRTGVLLLLICGLSDEAIIKDTDNSGQLKTHKDVITDKGLVRGFLADDGEYFAFFGIPYAGSPIGTNRFKAPVSVPSWNGTLEATRKVICPQKGMGEEDCLVVNVFIPKHNNQLLAVIVFFHGGSYVIGSGYTSGFDPLIKQDVIVVTVNYRLGAFGFLCLGVEDAPGNAGLKDKIAALKWVQNNIKSFGGNPKEVTIYGMSAGSASVEFLILSNAAKGLFNKAIMESSSALSVFATALDPVASAIAVGIALKFTNVTNIPELVANYQSVPADKLSDINYDYYTTGLRDGNFGFVPCVERELKDIEPFITEAPLVLLSKGEFDKVPILFSYTKVEGLFLNSEKFYEEDYASEMNVDFADFIPYDLVFDSDVIKRRVAGNVRRFYFGNDSISKDTKLGYLEFFGDYYILYPMMKSLNLHLQKTDKPVYLFEFGFKGNMGSEELFYDDIKLAGHGDIVKHAILTKPIKTEEDQMAVDRVSTIIANFAKFSNPLPVPTATMDVAWPQCDLSNITYIYIKEEVKVQQNPYEERIRFWDRLYTKYQRPITKSDQ